MAAGQLPPTLKWPRRCGETADSQASCFGEINGIFDANQAPIADDILQILNLENCYQSAENCYRVME